MLKRKHKCIILHIVTVTVVGNTDTGGLIEILLCSPNTEIIQKLFLHTEV